MRLNVVRLLLTSFLFGLLTVPTTPIANAAAFTLDQCVAAINDASVTKASIASDMGYTVTNLESAISAGTVGIYVANGPGEITNSASSNGNAVDLYCGDGNDNTVPYLDSSASTYDYFYGGGGNDSVTVHMWHSKFWGGAGNDYVAYLDEGSFFYGGLGTDSYTTTGGASTFDQGIDIDPTPPSFTSFGVSGGASTAIYRSATIISATVTLAGTVTFFAAGKRIPSCIKVATALTSPYTATCSWKPAMKAPIQLSALTTATSNGNSGTTVSPVRVSVSIRSNKR
jgi:hypothetical protein